LQGCKCAAVLLLKNIVNDYSIFIKHFLLIIIYFLLKILDNLFTF
jgi:hypothetical protein